MEMWTCENTLIVIVIVILWYWFVDMRMDVTQKSAYIHALISQLFANFSPSSAHASRTNIPFLTKHACDEMTFTRG